MKPLQVGDAAEREVEVTDEDIVRMATLVGDTNPLHHERAVGEASRFGAVIASGGHVTALLTGLLGAFTSSRGPALGLEVACRWRRGTVAGRLALRWEIVGEERSERLGGRVLALEGAVRDAAGAVLVSATAKVVALDPQR